MAQQVDTDRRGSRRQRNPSGAAGDDVIVGGSGRDIVDESAGRDQIFTDSGDDKVTLKRGGATVETGAGDDVIVAFNGRRDTVVCGSGRDIAYVDRVDRVKGCEKRVHGKPRSAAKRKKPTGKKSSRSRR
jgi:Ca2+-binding RTX toxin-like protein